MKLAGRHSVPPEVLASAKDYRPVDDSFARAYRLHLLSELDAPAVAARVVSAVHRRRRHVRLPWRATELLLTGIEHQPPP